MIWRPSALYGLLAAFLAVAGQMLMICSLRGWDQFGQPQFWVERASTFTGAFLGFLLFFALVRAKKQAREEERNDEPTPAG
jgi:hypothetical protein